MNLESLNLGLAFRLTMKTLPIILVRLGANLAFWLVAIIYLAIVAGVAALIGQAIDWLGVIVFLIGVVGVAPLYNLAYRYVFYMIKAAHIAIVSELLASGEIPAGSGQLSYGKQRVQERFGEVNVMFVVDELVTAVVHAFTSTVYNLVAWLPSDNLRTLMRIVQTIVKFAMNYIDEAILARSFWIERDNVWENARDGLVLYGMIWRPILINAVVLMIISYIPFIVAFLLFSAPVGFLLSIFSTQLAGWALIATLVLAYLIKVAIGDSFAMVAIIATYYKETQGKTPDPAMAAKLDSVSDKFGELKQRAQERVGMVGRNNADASEAPAG